MTLNIFKISVNAQHEYTNNKFFISTKICKYENDISVFMVTIITYVNQSLHELIFF
jgi:hypothetical protein